MTWLAFDAYFAAMFLDNPVDDRKPQSRTGANWLRRKKRIENARDNLGCNSRSVVGYFQPNTVSSNASCMDYGSPLPIAGLAFPRPFQQNGLLGVYDQI